MSISRLFNEFRPLFRMLDEPIHRAPNSLSSLMRTRPFYDDPFFASPLSSAFPGTMSGLRPAVDVSEEGNKYIVEAELPGVRKENVEVKIGDDGRSVTIQGRVASRTMGVVPEQNQNQAQTSSGEASADVKSDATAVTKANNDESNQLSVERHFVGNASFTRTVWLPRPVDPNGVSAKLNDGVLTITVPKAEDKGSVTIPVD
ncbi:HSP20-like chaperone [Dendrothele bispora CBS 962.96]|uniref:HSP20-like chaperone n=1 Tax=Dendrothele bispora (strain CBS 962.96) TaxID=1314807 RepID=A0A4S8MQJ3_DENBC|nr:HSP20-like chaperone [Dendrothele bispora CBS 962.96]